MDIIVCVKSCPEVAEAEIKLTSDGKDIVRDKLVYTINEADNYAQEEALLWKEKFGGSLTLITVGEKRSEDVLRMGLAKGADNAIRIETEGSIFDPLSVAQLLARAIRDLKYDLILTGIAASDDGFCAVGTALAKYLNLPYATMVIKTEVKDGKVTVHRELEGGVIEMREINLPALLTIQTGINTPRYASVLGIKKAASKEIKVLKMSDLKIEIQERIALECFFVPKSERKTVFIQGSPEEVAEKMAELFKAQGVT